MSNKAKNENLKNHMCPNRSYIMGLCSSKLNTVYRSSPIYTSFPQYKGAGILFTEGPVALAGIQKHRSLKEGDTANLSGFGGRREPKDFDWVHTAWREVVEELYNETLVPIELILELRRQIPVRTDPVEKNGYVMFCLGFDELTRALEICANPRFRFRSPIYRSMPLTITDLIMKRLPNHYSEIGSLALVPISYTVTLDPLFEQDILSIRT